MIEIETEQPVHTVQQRIGSCFAQFIIHDILHAFHPVEPPGPVGGRDHIHVVPQLAQEMHQAQRRAHGIGIRLLVHGDGNFFRAA